MELEFFDKLALKDFENHAVIRAIRLVFRERDKLRQLVPESSETEDKEERFQCSRCGGPIKHGKNGQIIPILRH